MKVTLFVIVFCFFSLITKAQSVRLLTVNDLENRIANNPDTTFVINFWATWCMPCVAELPHFQKVAREYAERPLKVIFVSLDYKSKLVGVVIPFAEKKQLTKEVYLLNESNQQEYIDRISKEWSGSIPATLIVNTKRKIRAFYEQEFEYDELKRAIDSKLN